MKKLLLAAILVPALRLQANDGVFHALGNTLIPMKETTIRLKKEVLSLERRGEWMQVDIYFEFFNPGPEKELTVGFVTPPAEGDVDEERAKHPQVKDFMVLVGNSLLPYKIARMEETGFRLNDKLANGFDFVYHFTVRFAKGLTVIRHSYLYQGGATVDEKYNFDYRLTTGTTWANAAIEDFELNISMGDDQYFSVPSTFGGNPAAWTVVGVGRLSEPITFNPYSQEEGGANLRMAYLRRGKLQLRTSQFRPRNDLSLVVYQPHMEVLLWCDKKNQKNEFADLQQLYWSDSLEAELARMTDEQLRLYRNLDYARMGYAFRDPVLQKVFAKFSWYLPDPSLQPATVTEYYVTGDLRKQILAEEKKRKPKTPAYD